MTVNGVVEQMTQWVSYQIRNIADCACAGNAGNVFPRRRLQRKPLVSDPAMHHVTCVTHVPWCMSGSLDPSGGETFPAHAHPQFSVSVKRPMHLKHLMLHSIFKYSISFVWHFNITHAINYYIPDYVNVVTQQHQTVWFGRVYAHRIK